jgi:transposase-like protein
LKNGCFQPTHPPFPKNNKPNDARIELGKMLFFDPRSYEPGYIHVDVTYLPKLKGIKYYLFVAIDRATRLMYFKVYENKTSVNAVEFLEQCKPYFPCYISHLLTDNGAEFTNDVQAFMRLKHYSIHTERVYCDWIKQYVKFHKMNDRQSLLINPELKVETFLISEHLIS